MTEEPNALMEQTIELRATFRVRVVPLVYDERELLPDDRDIIPLQARLLNTVAANPKAFVPYLCGLVVRELGYEFDHEHIAITRANFGLPANDNEELIASVLDQLSPEDVDYWRWVLKSGAAFENLTDLQECIHVAMEGAVIILLDSS